MKRKFLWILSLLLLIQFVRPDKNDSTLIEEDYSKDLKISAEVKILLRTACADCHSNYTNYPWYAEIAPISWYLAYHVYDGKAHLNFSEWDQYNKNQKKHILKDLKEELEDRNMPLKSYLLLHKKSKLTQNQYKLLLDWVDSITNE
jgi:hypothetical protein